MTSPIIWAVVGGFVARYILGLPLPETCLLCIVIGYAETGRQARKGTR